MAEQHAPATGLYDETLVAVPEDAQGTGTRTGSRPVDSARARPEGRDGPGTMESRAAASLAPEVPAPSLPASSERQTLAHRYEIQAHLGAGGMGTVYRARDLELEETVALKVLRRDLVDAPGMLDRFRREVKLARRVTHRNVARMFDIGEHEGEKFLTMEFVDGEPLSAVIAREGAMPVARAGAIARAIAEGLASAHEAGVVHRDLKPDNVLVARDGRVVVTDFGIARAVTGASQTMGALVGTPAYMAPEQVEARAEVDARADVYAFGALLYELLTGARSWPGESPFAVASARLLQAPPDPRAKRPSLPDAAADLVLRCMARSPEDRPASMAAIVSALEAVVASAATSTAQTHGGAAMTAVAASCPTPSLDGAASGPKPRAPEGAHVEKTVAVLPFRNTGAPDDEYLAEELTDDLIDGLSMTRGLRVRSRGSAARFRGADVDPREIGRELGVQVVVEGSVRRARGSVRISARLTSVADGFQLWAKRFDRPEQDVLSINDEVARSIAEALTLDCCGERRAAPSDPAAIDLYIRARHELRKFWPENVNRALALFEQARVLAPEDPLILSGVALALARRSFFSPDDDFAAVRRAAETAVAAAPHLGEGQLALGVALFHSGDPVGAARALRVAVSKSPGLAEAHAAAGRLLVEAGAVADGMRRLETAITLDPDAVSPRQELGRTLALFGQWDKALAQIEGLRARDEFAYWTTRARLALWQREAIGAQELLSKVGADPRAMSIPMLLIGLASGTKGREEIAAELDKLDRPSLGNWRRRAFFLQMRAEIFGHLGDAPRALDAIERALAVGLIDRTWLERCPLLEEARRDPGFGALHEVLVKRGEAIVGAYQGG